MWNFIMKKILRENSKFIKKRFKQILQLMSITPSILMKINHILIYLSIFSVLRHFAGSWSKTGTTSSPMIDFFMRLGLFIRFPTWYDNANCDYVDTWRCPRREAAHGLVAENRWPLPGAGNGRKGACMAFLSQRSHGLTPNLGHRDALP